MGGVWHHSGGNACNEKTLQLLATDDHKLLDQLLCMLAQREFLWSQQNKVAEVLCHTPGFSSVVLLKCTVLVLEFKCVIGVTGLGTWTSCSPDTPSVLGCAKETKLLMLFCGTASCIARKVLVFAFLPCL